MKSKNNSKIILCVLTFLYIFSLKIFGFFDSTMLVGAILTLFLLLKPNYRHIFSSYVRKIKNYKIMFVVGLLIIWALVAIMINQTDDYSYLETFFHLLLTLFIGIELATYYKYKGCADKIVNIIIICFLAQTVLQWIFLFFPEISQLFNSFRGGGEKLELLQERYGGRRGIALSGAGFFSLAASYGIVLLLYCSKYNSLFSKNIIIKTILFFFLLTGTFFAGRTGFIALLFIPFLFFMNFKRIKIKEVAKVFVALLTCLVCVFAIFSLGNGNERIAELYRYSFQIGNNLVYNGEIGSSSTDTLLDMYNVEIPFKTFVIGDAQYNVVDEGGKETYYKGVDPGYLRKIFYFGIIGVILSFLLQLFIYGDSLKKNRVFILLFLYMILLEFKGEIIGLNMMTNSVLILSVVSADYMQNLRRKLLDGNKEEE